MKCTQRLYLTADKAKLVGECHKKAASLYAVPGDEIPQSAADRFGLVDGHLKGFDLEAGAKEDQGGENKERKPQGDKAGGNDKGGQGKPASDNLETLKGVGHKTAQALVAGGLTSFAAIAAIDPAAPPAVDGIGKLFKWADVVADAKTKVTADQAAPLTEPA